MNTKKEEFKKEFSPRMAAGCRYWSENDLPDLETRSSFVMLIDDMWDWIQAYDRKHICHKTPQPNCPCFIDGFETASSEQCFNEKEEIKKLKRNNRKRIEEIKDKNLEFMEDCEPDCDEVRHARHQGSWEHYRKMDEFLEKLKD